MSERELELENALAVEVMRNKELSGRNAVLACRVSQIEIFTRERCAKLAEVEAEVLEKYIAEGCPGKRITLDEATREAFKFRALARSIREGK